ncbi:MAG: hypothetical protein WCJ14_14035 [Verrucomicrobiota bacterium]
MPTASRFLLLGLALTGAALADLPKKPPIARYAGLWTNSPFTSKPPPAEAGPTVNPLEDYTLAGVSPVADGYRVTLLNKKKPDERITVDSDNPKSTFKILEVIRKAGEPLGTTVRMASGTVTGTIGFDEKLLVLAAAPAAKPNPKAQPGAPPIPQPMQPGQQPQRQPRPRVVPPQQAGQPQLQPRNPLQPPQINRPTHRGAR